MSSDNPYSAPTTSGKLVEQPLESYGPRTYQRLVGQSRSPVIVLAVLAGGVSILHFLQFLVELRVIVDIAGRNFDLSVLYNRYSLTSFWKLVLGFIFLSLTLALAAVARAMQHLSRSRSTNLARLLLVENRFWWIAAVGLVVYAVGVAALSTYRYQLFPP